ncbi:MAG: transporter, CydDC cysteine exporter (CydDC-E) family, permease/ATP-binding protein CydD [Streptomyces oryziradicis]|nr:transporter, CydDC cysteine exporter (CydDC-E) family, permease/ATP-binding protein CydD [Actinacidiphila oryziradicis]
MFHVKPVDPRLLKYAGAARWFVGASVLLGLAGAALVIAQAMLIAQIVVGGFQHGYGVGELRDPLLLLAAVAAGRAAVAWLTELCAHRASASVKSELRRRLLARATELGPSWLGGQRVGELTALATRGVDALDDYFARYVPQLGLAIVVPVAVLGRIVTEDWVSALIITLTLPLIPVFMVLIGWATQARMDRQWRLLARLSGHFLDVVAGLPTLKVFGRAKAQAEAIRTITADYRRATLRTLRIAFISSFALELLSTISVALVAVTIGMSLVHGDLDLYTGLVVLVLAPEAYLPLRQVGTHYHAAAEGLAAAEDVFAVLEAPLPAPGTVPAPDLRTAVIEIDRLVVRDGGRLGETSLTLSPGETVAITGPSGAGKTTLLNALLGFVPAAGGRILVDGVDLSELAPGSWWEQIAWVPQRPYLFAGSIAENVRLARPSASDAELRAALREAGALDFAGDFDGDHSADAVIGDGGAGLSAGQRQRVALARAFLADRPLLLLDEPTANLDGDTEAGVVEAVRRLAAGRTVLLVVHRPALLAVADHTLYVAAARPFGPGGSPAHSPDYPETSGERAGADTTMPQAAGGQDSPGPVPTGAGGQAGAVDPAPRTLAQAASLAGQDSAPALHTVAPGWREKPVAGTVEPAAQPGAAGEDDRGPARAGVGDWAAGAGPARTSAHAAPAGRPSASASSWSRPGSVVGAGGRDSALPLHVVAPGNRAGGPEEPAAGVMEPGSVVAGTPAVRGRRGEVAVDGNRVGGRGKPAAGAMKPSLATAAGGRVSGAAGLRRVRAMAGPLRGRFALALVLGALAPASAVGLMATSAWLIARASQQPPVLYLMVAVTATRTFGLGRAAFRYAERLVAHDAVFRALADLRVAVYRRLERLAPAGLRETHRGDLLSRLVADVDGMQDYFLRWLLPVGAAVTVSLATAVFTGWLLPAAGAALAVGLLAAGAGVPALSAAVSRRAERRLAPARGELSTQVVDVLTGTAELTVAGALPARLKAAAGADRTLTRIAARSAASTALGAGLMALVAGMTVTVCAFLGVQALHGVTLAVVVLTPLAAFEAVAGLPQAVQHRQRSRAAARRVYEVLDAPEPVREPERPAVAPTAPFPLAVRGLTARHPGQARPALDGIDLELAPGRRVAVVGPSGSGKTTLAHVLLRFLDRESGTYTLAGEDAASLDGDAVRRMVGLCAQDAHIFDSTVRENVRLARPDAEDGALRAALAAARLDLDLDLDVGEHGARLSGGQRQRLALARAVLADFPVLVLDEPAEHLDLPTADALTADLLAATEGRTTLMITHRLAGLGVPGAVDEILVLDQGRTVQRGTFEELAAADGPFRRTLERERAADLLPAQADLLPV